MRLDGPWRRDPPAWSRRFGEAAIVDAGGDHGVRHSRHFGGDRGYPFRRRSAFCGSGRM